MAKVYLGLPQSSPSCVQDPRKLQDVQVGHGVCRAPGKTKGGGCDGDKAESAETEGVEEYGGGAGTVLDGGS